MSSGAKRSILFSAVVVLGVVATLAIEFPETNASERFASTGGYMPAEAVSSIELGPSQEAFCKRTTPDERINYKDCDSASQILAFMRAEQRDSAWADKMETDLSEWVESLKSEGFSLRNVECQLSWCIVEVGSTQGGILEMHTPNARKWKLFQRLVLFAPDVDDPNVEDQLIIYKRYCNSGAELFDGNGHLVPNFVTIGKNC